MKIIWHWLILSASVVGATFVFKYLPFPGSITVNPVYVALIVGAVLMFINATIRPIIGFLTLPLNILTLGLFSILINGLIFWLLASFISGFSVSGFTSAVVGAVIVSIINWILEKVF